MQMITTDQHAKASRPMKTASIFVCGVSVFAFLFSAGSALARENTLTGRISALQWYDSNANRTHTNTRSEWNTVLTPTMTLTTLGEHDSLASIPGPALSVAIRPLAIRVRGFAIPSRHSSLLSRIGRLVCRRVFTLFL